MEAIEGPWLLTGTIPFAAARTSCCRERLPKNEMIMPRTQMAANTPAVARSTRFKTFARELLPLAPSAARSCKMTWLKIWLRNSHCLAFLESPAMEFGLADVHAC